MPYIPNKSIRPGYTLAKTIQQEGITQKELSARTGISEKHLSHIISGKASITVDTALLLENALGGSASFWINLEKNFQETEARIERSLAIKSEIGLVDPFPYNDLIRLQYVTETTSLEEKVENLWRFFAVSSLKSIKLTESIAFRRSTSGTISSEAIASWLRCGEIEAKKADLPEYSASRLKAILPTLKLLSVKSPNVFSKEIVKALHDVGVFLTYIPHFKGTKVSGAVRWSGKNPVLQLSLYYTWADIFWFNLHHELGHLVLHGKKDSFIEFDNKKLPMAQEKEREADIFASNELIPPTRYQKFSLQETTTPNILAFAKDLGIHPGIIAGRLAHEGKISWPNASKLRDRLAFASPS